MLVPVLQFVNRVWPLALAAVLFLPLWSVWVRGDVSWGQKIVLASVWGVSAVSPLAGTVALAALLPLVLGVTALASGLSPTHILECLVLAFASGAVLRARSILGAAPSRLGLPAAILAIAAVTSAAVDLAALRAVAPARPFLSDLWQHVIAGYWGEDVGNWIGLHAAVRWSSVLAMAVLIECVGRRHARARPALVWLWLACAASAVTFTIVRVAAVLARQQAPLHESIPWLLDHHRISVLHPDPNAAGSIFGLLFMAALVVAVRRRLWWLLATAVPLLATGFVLAQSRAAIGSVVLVLGAWWLIDRRRQRRPFVPALIAAVAVVVVVAAWMMTSRTHASFATALDLRLQMAQVGLRMAERFPLFGVGLTDYARTSRRFVPAEFTELSTFAAGGENAHNNFLQVLVELGIPAFLAFLWLVVPAASGVWVARRRPVEPEYEALALGVSAFLFSALFGHPLLIPEVGAMFFFGLALASSHLPADDAEDRWGAVTRWLVGFFLLSLVWRL